MHTLLFCVTVSKRNIILDIIFDDLCAQFCQLTSIVVFYLWLLNSLFLGSKDRMAVCNSFNFSSFHLFNDSLNLPLQTLYFLSSQQFYRCEPEQVQGHWLSILIDNIFQNVLTYPLFSLMGFLWYNRTRLENEQLYWLSWTKSSSSLPHAVARSIWLGKRWKKNDLSLDSI